MTQSPMTIDVQNTIAPQAADLGLPSCRFCAAPLRHTFVDLGMSPLCESYVPAERAQRDGALLPASRAGLRTAAFWSSSRSSSPPEDIFSEYAYFSSYSDSWVAHARDYVDMAVERFGLSPTAW